MLERDDGLETLRRAAERAAGGDGSVVLVSGGAGAGKSTVVQAAVESVAERARVLHGECDDFITTRALGPLRDVARVVGGDLAAACADGDTSRVLDALLDEIDHPLRATVLVLEDLHWADDATLDVVRFLGRRIARLHTTLWITYRDGDLGPDHPLRGVLGALSPTATDRVELVPLSLDAVRSLTAGSGLDPDVVLTVTAGNPFFVTELVRAGGTDVPASVSDAVLSRVRRLPAGARTALARLAVLPGLVEPALVGDVIDDPDRLAELEQAGLLVRTEEGVRFAHELARRAVEESLTVTEQVVGHVRVLASLRAHGEQDASRLLHHALAAGRDDVVAEVGPSAAAEAFRADAHREAVDVQQRLLARSELLTPDVRASVLGDHVMTLSTLLRIDEAHRRADELVELRESLGDPGALSRSLLLLSRMAWWAGRREDAVAALDRARPLVDELDDPTLTAELAVIEAFHALLFTPGDEAVAVADRALAATRAAARPDHEAHALNYRGCALATANRAGDIEDLRSAIALGSEVGDVDIVARAHLNLLRIVVLNRPDVDVDAMVEEALRHIDDHDLTHYRVVARAHHAAHLLDSGRLTEADELLRTIVADVEDGGLFETPVRTALARVAVRVGADDADVLVERAWSAAIRGRAAQYLARARAMRAERAWLTGDEDTLDRLRDELAEGDVPSLYVAEALRWIVRSGRPVELPSDCPDPWRVALDGDWRAAADGFAARRQPYEHALELVASGEPATMLRALTVLDDLGAVPAARIVRRRLRDLGARPPAGPQRATRAHPLGLTGREAEVLERVATGATNSRIAEELVLSVKTVDKHVSSILRKLGVSNRDDAVAVARDAGV